MYTICLQNSKTYKKVYFQDLSNILSQIINKYVLIAGDLNIDFSESKSENDNHFSELKDTFRGESHVDFRTECVIMIQIT